MDNNIPERSIRSIIIGCNNCLDLGMMPHLPCVGSKAGGSRVTAIYSVVEACKLIGVEPKINSLYALEKIAFDQPAAIWGEFMPWN